MAVTAWVAGKFIANALGGETAGESSKVDWLSDDIRLMLLTSSALPNQDTIEFISDVVANEVAASGSYAAGGVALANKAMSYTAGTNTVMLDADDVAFTGATITARYAVIYDRTPATDATRPVIVVIDFGADVTSTAGPFTVTFAAAGIATFAAA